MTGLRSRVLVRDSAQTIRSAAQMLGEARLWAVGPVTDAHMRGGVAQLHGKTRFLQLISLPALTTRFKIRIRSNCRTCIHSLANRATK